VTGAVGRGPAALVVDLGGSDVSVAQQFLHLADIGVAVEQERGVGRAQRVGRVDAAHLRLAVLAGDFLHRAGQAHQVIQNRPVHRHFPHRAFREIPGGGSTAGAEERAGGEVGAVDILFDGLRRDGIDPDGAVLVAFLMNTDRGFALVKMEVLDFQAAAGGEADARVDIELEDGAIPVIEDRLAGGQGHQLAGARDRQRPGFLARVGRLAGDELRVRGIGYRDRQAQLGRGAGKILVEAGQRADAAVQRFGCCFFGDHGLAEILNVGNRHAQQRCALLGPLNADETDEGHDILAVRAPGMARLPALDPGLEDGCHGKVESLDALLGFRGELACKDRRQRYRQIRYQPIVHILPPPWFL